MFQRFRQSRCSNKVQTTRLYLEELEGRCLLSHSIVPAGGITAGPDGYVWFLEPDRLGRVDPNTGVIQEFAIGVQPISYGMGPGHLVTFRNPSIVEGQDGSIWFLTNSGATRFNPATNAIENFTLPNGQAVWASIAVAPDGKIWLLEPMGVASIDPTTGTIRDYSLRFAPTGLAVTTDGTVWTTSFASLEKLNPTTGEVQTIDPGSPIQPEITVGSEGHIWYAKCMTGAGVGELDPSTGAITIHDIGNALPFASGSNSIFFYDSPTGPGFEGIGAFDPTTGVKKIFDVHSSLMQIASAANGNVWFTEIVPDGSGALVNQLGELNLNTGQWQFFTTATEAPPPTPSNPPPASGTTFNATAGIDFKTGVASFATQTPVPLTGGAYQALVNWGDGSTSTWILTVMRNGTYEVVAGHKYQSPGTYSIKVTISAYPATNSLGGDPITVFSTANVDDAWYQSMLR